MKTKMLPHLAKVDCRTLNVSKEGMMVDSQGNPVDENGLPVDSVMIAVNAKAKVKAAA